MSNYISKLNETVERTHVRYRNRYGIALAGDLYTRIKAVVTASMFDMSAAARLGMTSEQIQERKERMSLQRCLQRWMEPKRMLVVPNCNYIDLYDDTEKIPFVEIERFLHEILK